MEEAKQTYQSIPMKKEDGEVHLKWGLMIQDQEDHQDLVFSDSMVLSSSSSSSLSSANGPLFHLTDLMNQLPMTMMRRKGLSKHYQGKSQSFTSLVHVKNLEDLAKKVNPYSIITSSYNRRRIKSCKVYATFDDHSNNYGVDPTVTNK